jgi:aminomethyltransferase
MDDTISPYEAKLMWTVRKPNKETGKYNESAAFIGRDALP